MENQNILDFSNLSLEDKEKILKDKYLSRLYCIELAIASGSEDPAFTAFQFCNMIFDAEYHSVKPD